MSLGMLLHVDHVDYFEIPTFFVHTTTFLLHGGVTWSIRNSDVKTFTGDLLEQGVYRAVSTHSLKKNELPALQKAVDLLVILCSINYTYRQRTSCPACNSANCSTQNDVSYYDPRPFHMCTVTYKTSLIVQSPKAQLGVSTAIRLCDKIQISETTHMVRGEAVSVTQLNISLVT